MAFTDEQKLIVSLLTDIHAHLGISNGLDPVFVQKMVSSDNAWALNWRYNGLFSSSHTPPKVRRVAEVLEMWEVVERTVAGLEPAEREEAESVTRPVGLAGARFQGYSGNDEDEYSIVHILVEDLGRWASFRGRDFNSHMPMVEVYDRMLDVYQSVNPANEFSPTLSVKDLSEVLNAAIHPENRKEY